jgi:orotate phosphoribosyltransferase
VDSNLLSLAKEFSEYKIIEVNLETGFKWASGIQSPFYCDNRKILGFPELRNKVVAELVKKIKESDLEFDAIVGVATGAIAWGALVAHVMNLPYGYCRSEAKAHGKKKMIEGLNSDIKKVLVLEDLISTGGSTLKVLNSCRDEGFDVAGVSAITIYVPEKIKMKPEWKYIKLVHLFQLNDFCDAGIIPKDKTQVVIDSL